ncbi:MAG: DEAD/DEAH box helicase [Lachnospiraceae bacterium]|nr:DEAD/DEAH box helicase [Lachnospiraceae bacterium]
MTGFDKKMPVRVTPFDHQQRAFQFVLWLFGLIDGKEHSSGAALLMQMGTGKTLVAIAVCGYLYLMKRIRRVLVVCPLSITGVWEEEFHKFANFPVQLVVLNGTAAKKRQQLSSLQDDGTLQVVVVNYESSWRLLPELQKYNADVIVADEAHKLKSGMTAQSKGMHKLGDKAKYKLLLTGTVITNHEIDVWSQYRFVNPQVFGASFYSFRSRYFYMGGYEQHEAIFRKSMTDDFLKKMHSIAFRVTKSECLDLPEITEEIRQINLEPAAAKLYAQIEEESFAEMKDSEVTAANVLTRILRLSQITGGFLKDDDGNVNAVSRAKLDALSDLIDSAMEEDEKVVVMARFRAELDAIEQMLTKKKIRYAVVRGGVNDRSDQVSRFQNDEDCRVFVGQIAAAGMGITLTAASTMVFFSCDYSMSNHDQARSRIHRAGQTRNCHYIYLVCRGSIDNKVLKALQEKQDLARMLVDDYRAGRYPFR